LRQLHKRFQETGDAEILIVYQKEPHAGQMAFRNIAQPETFEARVQLARRMKEEFEMPMTVLVDTMEDQSRALFSDLPSPVFIINSDGIIHQKFPWPESEQIANSVNELRDSQSKYNWNVLWGLILLVVPVALIGFLRRKRMALNRSMEERAVEPPLSD